MVKGLEVNVVSEKCLDLHDMTRSCDSSCNEKSVSNARLSTVDGSGCLFASLG